MTVTVVKKIAAGLLLAALLLTVACSPNWAANPADALSAKPDRSIYLAARVNNLGVLLKDVLTPQYIEMLASYADSEDAQAFRLIANLVANTPVEAVAFIAGTGLNSKGTPKGFLQAAMAFPKDNARTAEKLKIIESGKARPEDVVTLLLGDGALLLAAAFPLEPAKGDFGPYYTIRNGVSIAARDGLLLAALSSKDLGASVAALKDKETRLAFKRRFSGASYALMHIDPSTIAALSKSAGKSAPNELRDALTNLRDNIGIIKEPLEVETNFKLNSDSFLVASAANVGAALGMDQEDHAVPKSVKGAGAFLTGGGKALALIAGVTAMSAEDFSIANPQFDPETWGKLKAEAVRIGITDKDLASLFTGSMTFFLGGRATIMGQPAPGMYVAVTGKNGAAGKILSLLLADEKTGGALPLKSLSIPKGLASPKGSANPKGSDSSKGLANPKSSWVALYGLDPALVSVPFLVGAADGGDTLFLGILDTDALGAAPAMPPKAAELLDKKTHIVSFVDTAGAWEYLREQMKDSGSLLRTAMALVDDDSTTVPLVNYVLDASLRVNFVRSWVTVLADGTYMKFVDFSLTDVPPSKSLLPRLLEVGNRISETLGE
ncbi:MAG: hypothetical protein LBR38_07235 [Synergistaceae bacterium]|jgi:hypothetical protein|nr:hypothetical protein [Synergistaceae bacterium]